MLHRRYSSITQLFLRLEGLGQVLTVHSSRADDAAGMDFSTQMPAGLVATLRRNCATIRKEYGKDVDEIFSSFEDNAIATASIAQVHRAVLRKGRSHGCSESTETGSPNEEKKTCQTYRR